MATIKDVARLANVSLSTVSKYINGGNLRPENAAAIKHAIEELDYRANPYARNLKSQRTRSIGILMPNITAPFYGAVVTAFEKTVREFGYHTLISCYGANHGLERDNLLYLISNGIEGLIYIPQDLSAEEYYELTSNCNVPMVQVDRMIQGVATDAVLVDNSDAVYSATSKMIEKGHRRIAIISGPKSISTAKERQVGYLRALSDHNILSDEELFICDDHTFAAGYQGIESLLSLDMPPTAVISTNYDITVGMITAIHDLGLHIPDNIDVFGFDCVEICTMMKPPLPVVQQPEQEIGRTAANYLLERLQGYNGECRTTRLICKLL